MRRVHYINVLPLNPFQFLVFFSARTLAASEKDVFLPGPPWRQTRMAGTCIFFGFYYWNFSEAFNFVSFISALF